MYYNNRKLAMSAFWMIVGIALIVLSVTGVLDNNVYSGMGGALATVGALQIMRNLRYRKDAEYREKIDVELKDERNRYLRLQSWSWAGYLTVMIEGVGVIVAVVAGQRTIQLVLSYSVCLILLAYWISYLYLSKKY